jgi:23S rRNA (uracil1939-C5)-methyltransferase
VSANRFPDSTRAIEPTGDPVRIDALSYGGDAVARVGGKVAFIPFGAPGDLARLHRVVQRKSFCRAEIAQLERAGPARREAPCTLFGQCGGCCWQHVDYSVQLSQKQAILQRAIGRFVSGAIDFVPATSEFGYRRRVRAHWCVGAQGAELGFYRASSRHLVDVDRCLLVEAALAEAWSHLRQRLAVALEGRGTAVLLAGHRGEVHLSLRIHRGRSRGRLERLMSDPLAGLVLTGADGRQRRLGRAEIELDARGLRGSADAFAQASAGGDRALREQLERLIPADCRSALELHAGVGNLTRVMALHVSEVVAVESHSPSARLWRENAVSLGPGVELIVADAATALKQLSRQRRFELVVLDPPREGARSLVAPLLELAPEQIIYVSCDPMTLARDVAELCQGGYRADAAVGIDMMPQSFRFESIVRLRRSVGG